MALQLPRRRFSVDEYHQMAKSGILTEDDRVELIEGEIIQMSPIGHDHAGCVDFFANRLIRILGDDVIVRVQGPIVLGNHSEPEPDVAILRRRPDYYRSGHPTPADVLLVIEVGDSTVELDRQVKAPLYGRNGVPETWLVDLPHGLVLLYRHPGPDGYQIVITARRGDVISPLAFPDLTITVDDILG